MKTVSLVFVVWFFFPLSFLTVISSFFSWKWNTDPHYCLSRQVHRSESQTTVAGTDSASNLNLLMQKSSWGNLTGQPQKSKHYNFHKITLSHLTVIAITRVKKPQPTQKNPTNLSWYLDIDAKHVNSSSNQ